MLLARPPLPRVRRRRGLLFPRRRLAANQSRVPVPPVRSLHTVCPSEAVIRPGFDEPYYPGGGRNYDLAPDGRLLMIKPHPAIPDIHIVLDWFQELQRVVPTP